MDETLINQIIVLNKKLKELREINEKINDDFFQVK